MVWKGRDVNFLLLMLILAAPFGVAGLADGSGSGSSGAGGGDLGGGIHTHGGTELGGGGSSGPAVAAAESGSVEHDHMAGAILAGSKSTDTSTHSSIRWTRHEAAEKRKVALSSMLERDHGDLGKLSYHSLDRDRIIPPWLKLPYPPPLWRQRFDTYNGIPYHRFA